MSVATAIGTTACPLCGSLETARLFVKGGQQFSKCAACAFQFGRAETNANLVQDFEDYEPAYRQYLGPSGVDDANHDATLRWIEQRLPLDDPGLALLDVGTGGGKFLRYTRAHRRCRTAGIEPSAAVFHAFHLNDLGVVNTSLPSFCRSGQNAFDAVTVLDVIEHVDDPLEFARSLHVVTKPGGWVFLSTPDVGSVVARALGRRWYHYNRYHLSLFDSRTIVALGRRAGFVAVGLDHRGKRFPVGYLRRYVRDFLLGYRSRPQVAVSDGRATVSLNLFDIMCVAWRKPEQ